MQDLKTVFLKCLSRFIVHVITQHDAFLQRQQVTRIRPLLTRVEREFIVSGIDKFNFTAALQILLADFGQQVLQVIERDRVLNIFFPELDDL